MPDLSVAPLLKDSADNVYHTVSDFLRKVGTPDYIRQPVAAFLGALVLFVGFIIGVVVAVAVKLATPVAQAVLDIISQARKDLGPALSSLMASALSEMLGVEITGEDMPSGNSTSEVDARVHSIGNKIAGQLTKEFVPSGAVTPESGEAAAKAFIGYGVNFAVTNTFVSVLAELASDDHLEQWRELGVEIAQNLGLGRLQRRALGVLMSVVIEKPYTKALNARYRQDQLTEDQYVRAFLSGDLSAEEVHKQLSYKGYPDEYISILLTQLGPKSPNVELGELLLWNSTRSRLPQPGGFNAGVSVSDLPPVTQEQAIASVRLQGFGEDEAKRALAVAGLPGAKAAMARYASEVEKLAVGGFMDIESARALLQDLPISAEELHYRMLWIGVQQENPRRTLTLAEMEAAYVDGVVTLVEWNDWMRREGYGPQDQQTLTYLLQIKADAASHRKAGHPAVLTFAEIETAFTDGFIELDGVQAWLEQKKFSAHDQAVLIHIAQAKKAGKKPKA